MRGVRVRAEISPTGDSGCSTLDYFLGDTATIPPDRGVFLEETYRLHPDLCDLISGAFYEGRLRPAARSENRVVRGGGWHISAGDCRCAWRVGDRPSVRFDVVGFRPSSPYRLP